MKRHALTPTQDAVLDGMLRAEEASLSYPARAARAATWRRLLDEGYVEQAWISYKLTDAGRAYARGWRQGQEKRRRCA